MMNEWRQSHERKANKSANAAECIYAPHLLRCLRDVGDSMFRLTSTGKLFEKAYPLFLAFFEENIRFPPRLK